MAGLCIGSADIERGEILPGEGGETLSVDRAGGRACEAFCGGPWGGNPGL